MTLYTRNASRTGQIARRLLCAKAFVCGVLLLAVPVADKANAAGPVSVTKNGPNGSKNHNGGQANGGNPFTYTFTQSLASTAASTPAFQLNFTGGNGGNGSSASGFDGAKGGKDGASWNSISLLGSASLTTTQVSSPGFLGVFRGGNGGSGGDASTGHGGGSGKGSLVPGDAGGDIWFFNSGTGAPSTWSVSTQSNDSPGIQIDASAGTSGNAGTTFDHDGTEGSVGGRTPEIGFGFYDPSMPALVTNPVAIQTHGTQSPGLSLVAAAGAGGRGGNADTEHGGKGGAGGTPEDIQVSIAGTIKTGGGNSAGLAATSQGGTGGNGGTAKTLSDGGDGGAGGGGGNLYVRFGKGSSVATDGDASHGIAAYSIGGVGGTNGTGDIFAGNGTPGPGSASGTINVDLTAALGMGVGTQGDNSFGIIAQSVGGHGGSATASTGYVEFAVNGGSAGDGGDVTVDFGLNGSSNGAIVSTKGQTSTAVGAHSIGGGGGHGGDAFGVFFGSGGKGGAGGAGGGVIVRNDAALTTGDFASDGIFALSVGGTGGSGGSATALDSLGGRGGGQANGGSVSVSNTGVIQTGGSPSQTPESGVCEGCSLGILVQSIGGGGGKAGSGAGWFNLGGMGGGGGDGGTVSVQNNATITTKLDQSTAILAQSLGGGGGNGGAAVGGGPVLSASVGGRAGDGGNGNTVELISGVEANATKNAKIDTIGTSSHGMKAQSIGGGGGSGGYAVSVSGSFETPSVAVAIGGSGGKGGAGGDVTVKHITGTNKYSSQITTTGDLSHGFVAQSIGGGGGHGGASVAGTINVSGGGGVSVGVGGSGGSGGSAGAVVASNNGGIATEGLSSVGLLAQSSGGGGGDGGLAVAGSISVGDSNGVDVAVAGSGANGGSAGAVEVTSFGAEAITTQQDHSEGILAQSVGGGGGRGALAVGASLSSGKSFNFSMAGKGGAGNTASTVHVSVTNDVSTGSKTGGDHSAAVVAQSIGGGGGNGGTSVAANLSVGSAAGVALGGAGGKGSGSGAVTVDISGALSTLGDHSPGLMAQSLAGGGGNGGMSIAGSLTASDALALDVAIGGKGASGASANTVTATVADVSTAGLFSDAVVAQSIGGAGGNGGLSIAGALTTSDSTSASVAVGGSASGGGAGKAVSVTSTGVITATGDGARGIVAQSIGGSGGNGGMSLAGSFTTSSSSKTLDVSVGGAAGSGATGGTVFVAVQSDITTGIKSAQDLAGLNGEHAVLAQSIGGGGGNGGIAASGSNSKGNKNLTVDVGGSGGAGGTSDTVSVFLEGRAVNEKAPTLTTFGPSSHGVLAQSISGGGGNGGGTMTLSQTTSDAKGLAVTVGGSGGSGNAGGGVNVFNPPDKTSGVAINATGPGSTGILAQSIGGGGGNGGGNIFKNVSGKTSASALTVGVGGRGGTGGNGGAVDVVNGGTISTGALAGSVADSVASTYQGHGIFAQSIASGGGNGGVGMRGDTQTGGNKSLEVGVGGSGAGTGPGGTVTVYNQSGGKITTSADKSNGILAQSIGGGGGNGGGGVIGNLTNNSKAGARVGVGGSGKGGGNGGTVTLTNLAAITVRGDGSQGVAALSVGGGGGSGASGIDGSFTTVTNSDQDTTSKQIEVGIGGSSASGGAGGQVALTNSGAITTGTSASTSTDQTGGNHAIFAQSVGGGGGVGSIGISGNVTNSSKSKTAIVGIGGIGGAGASGSGVTVNNTGALSARGALTRGIFAASIGGGGGSGGIGFAGDVTAAASAKGDNSEDSSPATSGQIAFGLGGSGSGGGAGGAVNVNSDGMSTITTFASVSGLIGKSHGIYALSVGGGGGAGGAGIGGNVSNSSNTKSLSIGIGRSGGNGAKGGAVTVFSNDKITVHGDESVGIFAQSIGGSGGEGGIGVAGSVSNASSAESVTQLEVGVGGAGGSGNTGGNVKATLGTGSISTLQHTDGDDQMHGIFAQSIGGGGGDGSIGIKGDITSSAGSKALDVAIGMSGGGAGAGGSVTVTSSGTIGVTGDSSKGIFAQSVGGGGGDGGAGLDGTVSGGGATDSSDHKKGKTVSLAVGAKGGSGGAGGNVMVTNNGLIVTSVTGSKAPSQMHAVFAQSVGGGGGNGSITGSLVYGGTASGKGIAMSAGAAAGGGAGGVVQVATPGRGLTGAPNSHAVFAQSVGGGGGSLGDLGGMSAVDSWNVALDFGASGGSGGVGGEVTIINGVSGKGPGNGNTPGDQTTSGEGSYGLFAQSVGGGGGAGGDATGAKGLSNATVLVNLGGSSKGSIGNGGTVTVNHDSGRIITDGTGSIGIFAQSVGGGGGKAATGIAAAKHTLNLGGTGGASGDGGTVTVVMKGDVITRSTTAFGGAVAAHGVVAQSIGGGGGYGGNVRVGSEDNFGSGLAMNASGTGTTGNGGDVTVSLYQDISTAGAGSIGILAQSVGGGGGVKGGGGATAADALIGSGGGVGNSGNVTVDTVGNITTTGESAHGIFAQSAAGKSGTNSNGAPGTVRINVNRGSVNASGAGAHGIFAQSVGDGMGAIDVTVKEGAVVQGGGKAVISNAADGAGIFVKDGASTVTNAGTITSVLGTAGIAINGVGTTLTVDNTGTITGQILKASSIDLFNRPGGVINAGPLLDVDNLTNQGTLAVGGSGPIGTTRLTGNLTQGSKGVLAVDLDPRRAGGGSNQGDRLYVGGRAALDGRVAIDLLDVWQSVAGLQSVPLVIADGGLSFTGLEVTQSAVAQYALHQPTPGALHLGYNMHFANAGILAATNDNQDDIARHIHGIYRAEALDNDIARELIAIEDTASYTQVMNSLSAEIAVDNQMASLLSGIRFNDALLSCAERSGDYRFYDQGQCGWLRVRGQHLERHETRDNLGFDENSWQIAGGGQIDVGDGWHLGAGLSYENSNLNSDHSNASSDGDRFQAGVSAKRRFDATELSGSLAIGYGDFDIDRSPWPGVSINGTQRLWLYSGQLRVAHLFEYGRWTFKPRIDLGVDYLTMDGFNESGNSGFQLRVESEGRTYVNLQPAIDIATEIESEDGLLIRPKLTLGITQFLGNAAPSVTGRFAVAPGDVAPFTASTNLDKTRFDVAVGVDVFTRDNLAVRAEIFGSFSNNSESYGGGLKVAMPF